MGSLPTSGSISLSQIQSVMGGSNPISLSEYYAGGIYVPGGTAGISGAVPSSGTISLWNFFGASLSYSASGVATLNSFSWQSDDGCHIHYNTTTYFQVSGLNFQPDFIYLYFKEGYNSWYECDDYDSYLYFPSFWGNQFLYGEIPSGPPGAPWSNSIPAGMSWYTRNLKTVNGTAEYINSSGFLFISDWQATGNCNWYAHKFL